MKAKRYTNVNFPHIDGNMQLVWCQSLLISGWLSNLLPMHCVRTTEVMGSPKCKAMLGSCPRTQPRPTWHFLSALVACVCLSVTQGGPSCRVLSNHSPDVDGGPGRDVDVVGGARRHLLVDDGAVVLPLLQLDDLLLQSAVLLLRKVSKNMLCNGPLLCIQDRGHGAFELHLSKLGLLQTCSVYGRKNRDHTLVI